MPAVKAFALYAGIALFLDFLFQISCFVSLLALDTDRQASNRLDVCCFIHGRKKSDQVGDFGVLYKFFESVYVPGLLNKRVRPVIMVGFFGWLCLSLSVIPKIDVGLDQEKTMPDDSYVLKYFTVSFAAL